VTKIPPEHTAARALEDSFRRLGEERVRSRRRQRPRLGLSRPVLAAATSLLVVAGAATGTKLFLGDGGALRPDAAGLDDPAGGRRSLAPSFLQLARARAADPAGAQPWGLRTYQSAGGETCVIVGRVVGRRLGVVRQGQFKELATSTGGLCGPLDSVHAVVSTRVPAPSERSGETALYGIVDRTVTSMRVVDAAGKATPVRIAADGTFLLVRDDADPFRRARMVMDGSTGRRVFPLGR
jgi:hypothetical protein